MDRSVDDTGECQGRDGSRHEGNAEPGGDKSNDGLHLARLLDDPRRRTCGGHAVHEMVEEPWGLRTREHYVRLGGKILETELGLLCKGVRVRQRRHDWLGRHRVDLERRLVKR